MKPTTTRACPFCGSGAIYIRRRVHEITMACDDCRAEGPSVPISEGGYPLEKAEALIGEAAALWESRSSALSVEQPVGSVASVETQPKAPAPEVLELPEGYFG